jgi:hypothetical protein
MLVLVLAMLAAACGGGDDAGSGSDTTATVANGGSDSGDNLPTRSSTTNAGTEAPTATLAEPTLVCQTAAPVEIGIGESVSGTAEPGLGNQCFWVDVPEGLDSITVRLTGLTGNVNAGVGYPSLAYLQYPGAGPYWVTASEDVAEKSVVVKRPGGGPHYILVAPARPRVVSPYTLTVSADPATTSAITGKPVPDVDACVASATEVEFGEPFSGELTAEASEGRDWLPRAFFCVDVPDGVGSITVELSDVDGLIEMFTRRGDQFLGSDRATTGPTRTVVIDDVEAGIYHVDVGAATPGGASEFVLTVRES